MSEVEHDPGDPALASGIFYEVNVFGTPTGLTAQVEAGDPLPGAPVGFGGYRSIRRKTHRTSSR